MSPCLSAVTFTPASLSVQPNAPNFSPLAKGIRYFSLWVSFPYSNIGAVQREVWAERITPVDAQSLEISSTAVMYDTMCIRDRDTL